MSNADRLVKLANFYYLSAKTAQDAQFDTYFRSTIKRIGNLANWGLISAKHLLSNPEYAESEGLQNIAKDFPQIASVCQQADPKWADETIKSLETFMGRSTFYTSSGNAGTGYDSLTSGKVDGYTAPSWYMNSIDQLVRGLRTQLKNKPVTTTTNNIA